MLEKIPAAVGHALRSVRPGLDKIMSAQADLKRDAALTLTSSAFDHEAPLPAAFTADGAGVSPPLDIGDLPPGTASLVLVVEDADSPTPEPLCHTLAWMAPSAAGGLVQGALDAVAPGAGLRLGKNSFLKAGWLPPDPPTGHGPHRYCFQLFALDVMPGLPDGAGRGAVGDALRGHVLATGLLIGTYERR